LPGGDPARAMKAEGAAANAALIREKPAEAIAPGTVREGPNDGRPCRPRRMHARKAENHGRGLPRGG
jgi:hypothetical protein